MQEGYLVSAAFFLLLLFPFCRIIFFRHCVFCWSVFVGKCVPVCHSSVFASCNLVSDTHRKDFFFSLPRQTDLFRCVFANVLMCAIWFFSERACMRILWLFFRPCYRNHSDKRLLPFHKHSHSHSNYKCIVYIYDIRVCANMFRVSPPYSYQYRLEYKLLISNTKLTGSVAINAVNS